MADKTFDYIIVGGGAAGCVLANRLTEDTACRVCLIEAGPDYGPDLANWPADLLYGDGTRPESHPWGHIQAVSHRDPLPNLPRGKVMGGSAAINGAIWLHGSAADYDGWAALGNPGWTFDEILPMFRKIEADSLGGPFHGTDGPIPITRVPESAATPIHLALLETAREFGYPDIADFNGRRDQAPAVGPNPRNVRNGVRMHPAITYLALARDRPNLTILPETEIDRIAFDNHGATGVRTTNGRSIAAGEVILSAGAYGSPALLMRSGVGPGAHLRDLGIEIRLDMPGVGEHLLDHPLTSMLGPMTIKPGCEPDREVFVPVLITARSHQTSEEIDLHLYHGQFLDGDTWKIWIVATLQDARSEGVVRLTGSDPASPLHIDHRYFSDPRDLEALCDGVEMAAQTFDSAMMDKVLVRDRTRAPRWRNRDELREQVRASVDTTFHPSGTCKMGPASDPLAVVDHAGKVHGVEGIRVVDASIFPTGPRCNLHGPTLAAAERIAAMITGSG